MPVVSLDVINIFGNISKEVVITVRKLFFKIVSIKKFVYDIILVIHDNSIAEIKKKDFDQILNLQQRGRCTTIKSKRIFPFCYCFLLLRNYK